MKKQKILSMLVIGVVLSMLPCLAYAGGSASIWTVDSEKNVVDYITKYADSSWTATSFEIYDNGTTGKLLWTRINPADNVPAASVWTINMSTKAITGYETVYAGANSGWTATSYHMDESTGIGYMLWTRVSNGTPAASIWTRENKQTTDYETVYAGLNSGWTATSYYRVGTTGYLLWTRINPADNVPAASIWTRENKQTTGFETVYAGAGSGWVANSYELHGTQGYLEWTRVNNGTPSASVWTRENKQTTGYMTVYAGADSGWTATSFSKPVSAVAKFKVSSSGVLVVKKAGSGSGYLSDGLQGCGEACSEMTVPYTAGEEVELEVIPSDGSYFAGWEAADGTPLKDLYYATAGETVFAVFETK